jgi:hypothetical protein
MRARLLGCVSSTRPPVGPGGERNAPGAPHHKYVPFVSPTAEQRPRIHPRASAASPRGRQRTGPPEAGFSQPASRQPRFPIDWSVKLSVARICRKERRLLADASCNPEQRGRDPQLSNTAPRSEANWAGRISPSSLPIASFPSPSYSEEPLPPEQGTFKSGHETKSSTRSAEDRSERRKRCLELPVSANPRAPHWPPTRLHSLTMGASSESEVLAHELSNVSRSVAALETRMTRWKR